MCPCMVGGDEFIKGEISGGPPLPTDNRGSYDIATLAIFPEYVEFDAAEVLQFVVPVPAGRRPA